MENLIGGDALGDTARFFCGETEGDLLGLTDTEGDTETDGDTEGERDGDGEAVTSLIEYDNAIRGAEVVPVTVCAPVEPGEAITLYTATCGSSLSAPAAVYPAGPDGFPADPSSK
jgi:hypothetical protein